MIGAKVIGYRLVLGLSILLINEIVITVNIREWNIIVIYTI